MQSFQNSLERSARSCSACRRQFMGCRSPCLALSCSSSVDTESLASKHICAAQRRGRALVSRSTSAQRAPARPWQARHAPDHVEGTPTRHSHHSTHQSFWCHAHRPERSERIGQKRKPEHRACQPPEPRQMRSAAGQQPDLGLECRVQGRVGATGIALPGVVRHEYPQQQFITISYIVSYRIFRRASYRYLFHA